MSLWIPINQYFLLTFHGDDEFRQVCRQKSKTSTVHEMVKFHIRKLLT